MPLSGSAREFSISVIRQLTEQGYTAYWAGGCVRDLLMDREPTDFDVATNATPQQVRQLFGHKRTLAVGESFGVIIVLGPKSVGQVEVATFRSEGEYHDGRRPSTVDYCDAERDALRRDFTINGMFFDPVSEEIRDYVGGQDDLRQRLVRAIGNPRERFTEDKLRLLRAVRFAALLNFELDSETAQAVQELASQIVVVSAERIAQELRKMLSHPQRAIALQLIRNLDLLPVLLPEVEQHVVRFSEERWDELCRRLAALGSADFPTAMAALLRHVPCPTDWNRKDGPPHGTVPDICRRLKLSNEERDRIAWLVSHAGQLNDVPTQSLASVKRLAAHPDFLALLQIERSDATVTGQQDTPFTWLDTFLQQTPSSEINPPELVTGRDLVQLGHQPGPAFRIWLEAIRDAQLNGTIITREDALDLLSTLVQQGPPPGS